MMRVLRQKLLAAVPAPVAQGLRDLRKNYRGWIDRLCFPAWLLWQCALHRQRAVVIWRIAAMGDVVCTLPLCLELRKRHPDRLLIYVTSRGFKDVVVLGQVVDVALGINMAYGAPIWISTGVSSLGLIEKVYEPLTTDEKSPVGVHLHLVEDLARSCGVTLSDRQPRLHPSDELVEDALARHGLKEGRAHDRLLIGINGGHTWPVREWDAAKWQQVIDLIHANYRATIIQFGLRLEPGIPDPYNHFTGVRSLVNQLHALEMVALVAACDLMVSIDSGPVHLAGAVGTSVVGLFGAVNPQFRMPPDSPSLAVYSEVPCLFCHHQTPVGHWKTGCPYEIRCMKELEVGPVFQAIQAMLPESARRV